MSSLRNAVKRITHKERSQPRARAHLGILEKHGDYKQRAVDYHQKQDQIQRLRQKAAQRNPDEFYFGMHKAQVQEGKHRITQEVHQANFDASIGPDTIRLMKGQDLSYIRMQKQKDTKKVERLQASLHFLQETTAQSSTKKRKHTVFVQSQQEARQFNAAQHFDTLPELLNRSFHRPRLSDLKKMTSATKDINDNEEEEKEEEETARLPTAAQLKQQEREAVKVARKLSKARQKAYKEMQLRSKRVAKLERAEAHLETEKLLNGKGRRRKIKEAVDGRPAQYKWRRKRLR